MATGIRRGECLSGDLRERAGKSESGYAPKLWTVGSRYKCRAVGQVTCQVRCDTKLLERTIALLI